MVDEDFDDAMFDEDEALALEEGLDDSVDLVDDDLVDEPISDIDIDDIDDDDADDDGDVLVDGAEVAVDDVDGVAVNEFEDEFDEVGVVLPPTATFDGDDDVEDVDDADDDDDIRVSRSMIDVDDDDDEDDTVREGEFVCRSCFMAKRESALADEDRLLCLDCV